ncbi:MAG: SDR family oxidoreductase [Chlorobiales bacterium]|nr:SDR family oxidoreductase [Chlorobiales bacterium]
METIMVTGASGQLGHRVISALLKTLPASQIVAAARNTAKASDLVVRGVAVREADYDRPETLDKALLGIDKLLLISSSEIGKRASQHKAVIAAAKRAGVKLLAYTSVLHADTSVLGLAEEHRQTEAAIRASGIPYVFLRNGWYTENYLASVPSALERGAFLGSAKEGRISSATREDYADAAAAVLLSKADQGGKVYELAGDDSYTLADLAAEVSRQTGKGIIYKDLPESDYKAVLINAGLPEPFAALLADSDVGASQGALYDESHTLSRLIGRPTTSLKTAGAKAITN